MAVRKQRATTSTLYAMEKEYKEVLSKAKKIHRYDGEFYIYKRNIGFKDIIRRYFYYKELAVILMSFLAFFAIAEILPRFPGIAMLPDRAWIFTGIFQMYRPL